MSIERLSCHGLRNLQPLTLHPGPGINLVTGANGSGKTSLLEGLYILGMGRSFRTRQLKNVIQHEADELTLFGRLAGGDETPGTSLGVRRPREDRELELRLGGERPARLSELVGTLPLQLINPDAFRLLEGPPARRREFLDWGVFHVKHEFLTGWKRMRRALKHRNALLRRGKLGGGTDVSQLDAWEHELATRGEQVDRLRRDWFSAFLPLFEQTLDALMPLERLTLHYARGWDKKRSLAEVLQAARETDEHMGFTQQGPQRADLRIRVNKKPAVEVLSRGQQKLVVSAMKLAQGRLLESQSGPGAAQRHCVYLIDDLPAELDSYYQQRFCELLESMQCQAFITSVEPNVRWLPETKASVFHVKQSAPGEPGQSWLVDGH